MLQRSEHSFPRDSELAYLQGQNDSRRLYELQTRHCNGGTRKALSTDPWPDWLTLSHGGLAVRYLDSSSALYGYVHKALAARKKMVTWKAPRMLLQDVGIVVQVSSVA